jgi:hypothetical protein
VAGSALAVYVSASSASINAVVPYGTSGRQRRKTNQSKIATRACACNFANELIKALRDDVHNAVDAKNNGREMKQMMIAVASFVALGILTVHAERVASEMTPQSEDNEIRVVYDKSARIGVNAVGGSGCTDCSIAFNLKNVR